MAMEMMEIIVGATNSFNSKRTAVLVRRSALEIRFWWNIN